MYYQYIDICHKSQQFMQVKKIGSFIGKNTYCDSNRVSYFISCQNIIICNYGKQKVSKQHLMCFTKRLTGRHNAVYLRSI